MRLSIRWRLTLWNTLALAGVLFAFAILVYGLTARALYAQADRTLLDGYRQLQQDERPEAGPDERLAHWVHELKEHNNVSCVVYGPDGKVLLRTEELADLSVPEAPQPPDGGPRLHDRAVPGLGRQRVLEGRLGLGKRDGVVLLMAPLDEVDRGLGTLLAVLLTAVPVALAVSGGVAYLLARKALAPVEQLRRSTRDITADRLDRRLPVADPGDELGRLAATINDMIGRLERSFAEVRRFTADASHELRTPLTAIRTEAEVALSQPLGEADCRPLLGSILEECERLTRLTEQLLTLAREDAGVAPQVREPVDLVALVRGVVDTMRPLAESKGVGLDAETDGPVEVRGDGARLRQVVYNVVDNAIKYTPGGGEVVVAAVRRAGEAIVAVRDTGVGIPAEHLPHVFDRFYRVDRARSREQGGTGLGLSIARSIVLAHRGRISLDSTPGRGTLCTVSLPGDGNESPGSDESRIAPSKESER
jgi:heavy metal sensor kinase